MPCHLVSTGQRFGEICRFHLQGFKVIVHGLQNLEDGSRRVPSKRWGTIYPATQCDILEERNLRFVILHNCLEAPVKPSFS